MVSTLSYWSISSKLITEEAQKLGFQVNIINRDKNLFEISDSNKSILFKSSDFWENSALSYKIADDKGLTYDILRKNDLPTTETHYVDKNSYDNYINNTEFSFPVVIKPLDEWHWNGVETNITNKQELIEKISKSLKSYNTMIIQKQIFWDEFRFVILRWKTIAVLKRVPASVVWDWTHTIQELVNNENSSEDRQDWYSWKKSKILLDNEAINFLEKSWLSLWYIPKLWEVTQIRGNSNYGTWWSIENYTDITHKSFKNIAENCANMLQMWFSWIDIMCQDITAEVKKQESVILEINATPWLLWNKEVVWENIAKVILTELFSLK